MRISDATLTTQTFLSLADSCMTPGGLNEQLHAELTERGTYTHYEEALDRVLERVVGVT